MSQANPNIAMLLQALGQGQAAPNPPLSQDPTAEARVRGGSRNVSDADMTHATMTHGQAGRGSVAGASVREHGDLPNVDTGVQSGDETEQPISPAVTNAKGVPWNVQVERGTGNQAQTTNYGFGANGTAPTVTAAPTPEQTLAQQNAMQVEAAKHPQIPHKNYDRQGDLDLLKQLHSQAAAIREPYSKVFANTGGQFASEMSPDDKQHLSDLNGAITTLTSRLIGNQGYGDGALPETATQGATAPQQAAPQPQAPKSYQPGMKVSVGDVVTTPSGHTVKITRLDADGNPAGAIPVQ